MTVSELFQIRNSVRTTRFYSNLFVLIEISRAREQEGIFRVIRKLRTEGECDFESETRKDLFNKESDFSKQGNLFKILE